MTRPLRVLVIYGGNGPEAASGIDHVSDSVELLDSLGVNVHCLGLNHKGYWFSDRPTSMTYAPLDDKSSHALAYHLRLAIANSDCPHDVIVPLIFGAGGEDGEILIELERLGLPYFGPSGQASLRLFDKVQAKDIFKLAGAPVPQYRVFERGQNPSLDEISVGPYVVKPVRGGSSQGLSLVEDPEALDVALGHAWKYANSALVEEYIPSEFEFCVAVLSLQACEPRRIAAAIRVKFSGSVFSEDVKADRALWSSENIQQVDLPTVDAAMHAAIQICELTNFLGLCRFDVRSADSSLYFLECDTIAPFGRKSLSRNAFLAAGIDFDAELLCALTAAACSQPPGQI